MKSINRIGARAFGLIVDGLFDAVDSYVDVDDVEKSPLQCAENFCQTKEYTIDVQETNEGTAVRIFEVRE